MPIRHSSSPRRAGPAQLALALPAAIAQDRRQGRDTGFATYAETDDNHYLAAFTAIPGAAWFVASTIPAKQALAEAQSVRDKIILTGLLCLVLPVARQSIFNQQGKR
ncbi:hypothetical protein ACFDR9_004746 [Janthinobacterium sp. CG_23.3]|uniref:hypothetical protein n=1 Tax=Janthinobacterium sp. CG_23.3 TaxID=3349634 RepID=UPI0038D368AA